MKDNEYTDLLLARYFAGESLSPSEDADLKEWQLNNPEEFCRINKLLGTETPTTPFPRFDVEKAWNRVVPQLHASQNVKLFSRKFMAIAATVVLLIGFSLFWILKGNADHLHYQNITAQNKEIVLPDHSHVTLFPGAEIEYKAFKNKGSRLIEMRGKAFFKVSRMETRPFIIDAGQTEVKVLGTSFLVNAISRDTTEVKVKTGKVSVVNEDENVTLIAGEQVYVTPALMEKSKIINPEKAFGDIPPVLTFKNASLTDVIERLEEIYGVTIDADTEISKNRITTKVNTENLENILTEISLLSRCKVERVSDKHYRLYTD